VLGIQNSTSKLAALEKILFSRISNGCLIVFVMKTVGLWDPKIKIDHNGENGRNSRNYYCDM
jgi:hypothetical protein